MILGLARDEASEHALVVVLECAEAAAPVVEAQG